MSILFVLLNLALRAPFGGPGLAAATSFFGLILAVVMGGVLRRHLGGLDGGEIAHCWQDGTRLAPGSRDSVGHRERGRKLSRQPSRSAGPGGGCSSAAWVGGAGLLLFAAGAVVLRIPEAHGAWAGFAAKLRRS